MKGSIVLLTFIFTALCIANPKKGMKPGQIKNLLCRGGREADAALEHTKVMATVFTLPEPFEGPTLQQYKNLVCDGSRKAEFLIKHVMGLANILLSTYNCHPDGIKKRDFDTQNDKDKKGDVHIGPDPRCKPATGTPKVVKCKVKRPGYGKPSWGWQNHPYKYAPNWPVQTEEHVDPKKIPFAQYWDNMG